MNCRSWRGRASERGPPRRHRKPSFPDLAFCAFVRSILGGANWTIAAGHCTVRVRRPTPPTPPPPPCANRRLLQSVCSSLLLFFHALKLCHGCFQFFFGSRLAAGGPAGALRRHSRPVHSEATSLPPSFPYLLLSPKVNDFRSLFPIRIERKDAQTDGLRRAMVGTREEEEEEEEEEKSIRINCAATAECV